MYVHTFICVYMAPHMVSSITASSRVLDSAGLTCG